MVREAGLEPARPEWTLEPESSESANSTTRALFLRSRDCSSIVPQGEQKVKHYFAVFCPGFPVAEFAISKTNSEYTKQMIYLCRLRAIISEEFDKTA